MSKNGILKVLTETHGILFTYSNEQGQLPSDRHIWCFVDSTGKDESGWFFNNNELVVIE